MFDVSFKRLVGVLATFAGSVVVGCGSTVDDPDGGGGSASTSLATGGTSRAGSGSTGSDGYNGPEECRDAELFQNAPCLTALRARCLELPTEEDCDRAEMVAFGDPEVGQLGMICRWATVVPIVDAASCTVGEPFGRCEGASPNFDALCGGSACDAPGLRTALNVLPPNPHEFVKMDCGPPVGYWWEVGYVYSAGEGICLDGVIPPAPPLCDCAEAACAKLGE